MQVQQDNKSANVRIDPQTTQSNFKGVLGLYERVLRRFQILGTLIALLPMYAVGVVCFSVAFTPGALVFQWGYPLTQAWSPVGQAFGLALLVSTAYALFGFTLILVSPALNILFRASPKPWRGPYFSLQTVGWGIHNVFAYLPRYTFLEFLTPTPFNILFYRLMGMKIGKGVQLNTTNVSDPALIEIEDYATIGGSATIVAHYGQSGYLVLAPVKIGKGVTVGLRATVMGGVEIGEYAKILPNSLLLPKTVVPPGETWGGVPAQKMDLSQHSRSQLELRKRAQRTTRASAGSKIQSDQKSKKA